MKNILENFLCCPICKSIFKKNKNTLICIKNKHIFEIKQGIPVLLDLPSLHIHSQNQQALFEKTMHTKTIESVIHMKYHEVRYLERFAENFEKIKNKYVIEIGTGSGYMAIGLAKLGAKVIACDITLTNLIALKGFAKTLGLENNLSLICCSADQLPLKNNTFDYFVINAVLEHIPAENKAINEIKRTLKKGGGLMITVPLKYKFIFPPLLLVNYLHDKRIGHLRRYDEVSLQNKFSGFSLKRVYFTGHVSKVIKFILNKIVKVFNEKNIEIADARKENIKMWASNVIVFLYKK